MSVLSIRNQIRMAIGIGLFGVSLLIYMVLFEDEPGGVPMVLILAGALWYGLAKRQERTGSGSR